MVFDDIAGFSDDDLQSILNETKREDWAVALKGGADVLLERIAEIVFEGDRDAMLKEVQFTGRV